MGNTLWFGSNINSDLTASVYNQLYNRKAIAIVQKKNAFLYAILGKPTLGVDPQGLPTFERLDRTAGNHIEVRLLGKVRAIGTIADDSDALSSSTPAFDANKFGGAEFDQTEYADTPGMPNSEKDQIQGNEAKTASWIDDNFTEIMLSFEDTLGTAIHAQVAGGTRSTMSNWQHAIADYAIDSNATFSTYGTIDRQQSANADFCGGYINTATGNLNLSKLATARNTVDGKGGVITMATMPLAEFTKMQGLLEAYTHAIWTEKWSRFGGVYVDYQGVTYIMDQRQTSGVIGMFDPTSWVVYQKMVDFTSNGWIVAPHLKSALVMPWHARMALICKKPNSNAKLLGVTT